MSADLAESLAALAEGRMIVISGDEFRGGEIDFCIPARNATAEAITFMALHGRGLVCLAMTPARAIRLGIELIDPGRDNQSGRPHGRSIGAARGIGTGISATDRAHTIRVAASDDATADDLVSPGHVFPLIAREGGLRERRAATEAAIDACRRAGAGDAAVICSIMRDDGEMARIDDIAGLVAEHGLPVLDIASLID